jgi:hypothetical protein
MSNINKSDTKICSCVFLNSNIKSAETAVVVQASTKKIKHKLIPLKKSMFQNINDSDGDGFTPLMRAIICPNIDNKFDVINSLLIAGANVNAKNYSDEWYTPLIYAINYTNNIEIVKLLLDKGADVNNSTQHEYLVPFGAG